MPLSVAALVAAYAESTGEQFVQLLTLSHTDFPATLRYADDEQDFVSRSQTFSAKWFDLEIPSAGDRGVPRGQLVIDSIDPEPIRSFRTATSPISMLWELVLASQPDTVDASGQFEVLPSASYDGQGITANIMNSNVLGDEYPQMRFSPPRFKGLF